MYVDECIVAFAAENFTGIRLPHRTTKRDDLFYNSYCNKEIKLHYFFRDFRRLFKRGRLQSAGWRFQLGSKNRKSHDFKT